MHFLNQKLVLKTDMINHAAVTYYYYLLIAKLSTHEDFKKRQNIEVGY